MVRILDICPIDLNDEETSQDLLPSIDSGSSVSSNSVRISQFKLDTPNDKEMPKREELLSYQNHNRGVGVSKMTVDTLPIISYRLRKLSDSSDDRKSVMAEWSDDVKSLYSRQTLSLPKVNNSFSDKTSESLNLPFQFTHGTMASKKPNKGKFFSNNTGIVVSQKMILSEREHKPTEKLPLSHSQSNAGLRMKGIWSRFELQGLVTKKPRAGVKSLFIPPDRIGPTTKYNKMADKPRTLGDVLKTSVPEMQRRPPVCVGPNEGCSNNFRNSQTKSDHENIEWINKLNTRLIDDLSYDGFARTERTPY